MLTRLAHEKALLFEPLVSNETTLAAMREARAGGLKRADNLKIERVDSPRRGRRTRSESVSKTVVFGMASAPTEEPGRRPRPNSRDIWP